MPQFNDDFFNESEPKETEFTEEEKDERIKQCQENLKELDDQIKKEELNDDPFRSMARFNLYKQKREI